ncbi:two component system response regulator [Desulfosarcina variabilis str. Montpellier]|uniref:response regulator n=1 Tax=Desulfosarcina variabilis TaxID=2300 RepID=UPI003AFB32E9
MPIKGKILVVDNETDQLNMMREILRRIGYEAKMTDNPEEALKMITTETFSAVFIDLIMPDIEGTDLCEQIKGVCPRVPVFAFSGHTHLYSAEQMERAGFDGSIRKPATIEEIETVLTRNVNSDKG